MLLRGAKIFYNFVESCKFYIDICVMIMKQKRIWMNCLRRGKSVLFIILASAFIGCEGQTDYLHKGSFYYKNESSHTILMEGNFNNFSSLKEYLIYSIYLLPNETKMVVVYTEAEKNIDAFWYQLPFYVQTDYTITIDNKYVLYQPRESENHKTAEDRGFMYLFSNYVVTRIDNFCCKFVYTFTDENVEAMLSTWGSEQEETF